MKCCVVTRQLGDYPQVVSAVFIEPENEVIYNLENYFIDKVDAHRDELCAKLVEFRSAKFFYNILEVE